MGPLYGLQLIEVKLRELGATKSDLARKIGITPQSLNAKLMKPTSFYIKEVQIISVVLGFTPEQIYNSFILMYGFPIPKDEAKKIREKQKNGK